MVESPIRKSPRVVISNIPAGTVPRRMVDWKPTYSSDFIHSVSSGIVPDVLPPNPMFVKLGICPSSGIISGRYPSILVASRNSPSSKESLKTPAGMVPLKDLLFSNHICLKLVDCPMLAGRVPLSAVFVKSSSCRFVSCPKFTGSVPDILT
jgi:hypothetical protein